MAVPRFRTLKRGTGEPQERNWGTTEGRHATTPWKQARKTWCVVVPIDHASLASLGTTSTTFSRGGSSIPPSRGRNRGTTPPSVVRAIAYAGRAARAHRFVARVSLVVWLARERVSRQARTRAAARLSLRHDASTSEPCHEVAQFHELPLLALQLVDQHRDQFLIPHRLHLPLRRVRHQLGIDAGHLLGD